MSWSADIEEIYRRRRLAEKCGGPQAVARHHAEGKLTVREGIAPARPQQLPGRRQAGGPRGVRGERTARVVHTLSRLGGHRPDRRPARRSGRGGLHHQGRVGLRQRAAQGGQGGFIEDLAWRYRIPLVNLIDGVAGSVESIERRGHTTFPGAGQDGFERPIELLGAVPVVSAVMGTAAGGPSGHASLVVERDSAFEIQLTFGRAVIICLARLGGKVVGVIAYNPRHGGVVDVKAARKQTHFTELCDNFNIPLVSLVDVPGFQIAMESEAAGMLRIGMQLTVPVYTVPVYTVVVRKCYGIAGGSIVDRAGLNFKIAWPSAEWGSLFIVGGVKAALRREIEAAPDPARREQELEEEMRRLASPFRTAEAFAVEDQIDPRETCPYLCRFLEVAWPGMRTRLGPKARLGVRP